MQKNGIEPKPYNYDDDKPIKTPRNSIIHLHGMISKATEENVLDQLVLTQKSYIKQFFATSSWYDEFRRDLRFCEAVFFIGYSLQDPHVTALIPIEEEIRKKTFFITKDKPDDLLTEDIQDYGEIHPISTSGFARVCQSFQVPEKISDFNKLKSLKIVDVFKDQKGILPPTPNEIFDLIVFGRFSERRCLSNLPEPEYIIPRNDIVNNISSALIKNNTVLVHSHLGNGKTTLIWSVAHFLTRKGFFCFRCVANSPTIEMDIEAVAHIEKLIIFFDSYDIALGCIDRFVQIVPHAKFIVNVRTGLQQVRIHEIVAKLPGPIRRIDANDLSNDDRDDLITLLEKAGIVKNDLRIKISHAQDLRNIVTVIYDNQYVKGRINDLLRPVLANKKVLGTVGICLILTWIGQSTESSIYMELLDVDPIQVFAKYREEVSDILDFDGDSVRAKSPIFAEYILQTQFDPDDMLLLIKRILIVAVSKKSERRYRTILSSLMSFARLLQLLKNFHDAGDKIRRLYEDLQRDKDIRQEPLFWLQYTIAMIDADRIDVAEGFMISAYEKAKLNPAFETYQLDTQALRLNLIIETLAETKQPVRRIKNIITHGYQVKEMIGDHMHRRFAIKVIENFKPFIVKRAKDLEESERKSLGNLLQILADVLSNLSAAARADSGADITLAELRWCLREMDLKA